MQRRKRILIIGPWYPYRGGIVHFLETIHSGLTKRGYDVSVMTFKRQYPELLFPGKTQLDTASAPTAAEAPRVLDAINPWTWHTAVRRIREQQPDVVLFKFWMPFFGPLFGYITRRIAKQGIRSVAVVDNAIPHERRPGDLSLARYGLGACHGHLVMSEEVERDLKTLGLNAPVARVNHPVYDYFGESSPREAARRQLDLANRPTLLFFGFIRRYKGLHILLDAMPHVMARLPDVQLVVAGEFYHDEAAHRAQIRDLGLEDHVRLHADYIANDQVGLFFSAADVVVQPYLSATQSGVAQIAYHFDRSLIVTDVGGLPEVVPHEQAGLIVPPNNPEALGAAIVRFFEDSLQPVLEAGVREEKHKYSWDQLYEGLEQLF